MRFKLITFIALAALAVYFMLPKTGEPTLHFQVSAWGEEFGDLCDELRKVRNRTTSAETGFWLENVLDRSACAQAIGPDHQRVGFPPPGAAVAPVSESAAPPAAADVEPSQSEPAVPFVRQVAPGGYSPKPHMVDTCRQMKVHLDNPDLSDQAWKELARSFNDLCMG